MSDPLTTINTAISLGGQIASLVSPLANAELQLKVADLTLNLAQTKTSMANLIDEVRQLKTTIAAHTAPKPILKDNMYYFGDDGPFCTACFGKDDKRIPLTPFVGGQTIHGQYHCLVCKAKYGEGYYS